jgi:RNA polymerase sigma-70 factor (ECF subfamily)
MHPRADSDLPSLFERHRRELQAHCYRMLGSFEESEDLVQETFLRAWRARDGFGGDRRFAARAWLYRIATNACLDVLRSRPRRVMPPDVAAAADPAAAIPPPADLPWLQPYPDRLLAPAEEEPDAVVGARETIELTFVAAIQHLPPRQRAVLILRDVVGWSAKDVAGLLETTVVSVNSALQRARSTLADQLGERRTDWTRSSELSAVERDLLNRFLDAHARTDADALAALLREDVRLVMPPHATWFDGRDAVVAASRQGFDPGFGDLRSIATAANGQPAAAHYLKQPGDSEYRALVIDVLRVEDGGIAEITSFVYPHLFAAFDLPPVCSDEFFAAARFS